MGPFAGPLANEHLAAMWRPFLETCLICWPPAACKHEALQICINIDGLFNAKESKYQDLQDSLLHTRASLLRFGARAQLDLLQEIYPAR